MSSALDEIMRTRIVGIVRLEQYDCGLEIAQALVKGGISVIEFTLTGRGAFDAIKRVRAWGGDVGMRGTNVIVGIGSVLYAKDAHKAIDMGAQFVVTPMLRRSVIDAAHEHNVPAICGALTPTEALDAHEAGAELIKIFPARLGGPQYLRDILAPLPQMRLVPTGGIDAQNADAYLRAGAVAVGLGGSLVSAKDVANNDWAQITRNAQRSLRAINA